MNNEFRLQHVRFKESKEFERKPYTFSLEDNIQSATPYTTIVIGPNGTGKSRLLRALVDIFNDLYNLKEDIINGVYRPLQADAYDLSYFIGKDHYFVTFDKIYYELQINGNSVDVSSIALPDVCIAAAYTLHEKFVMNNDTPTRRNPYSERYKPEFYKYLGIKSHNNYAFSSANINKALDLITEAISIDGFNKDIQNVFKFLNFNPAITISYDTKKHSSLFQKEVTLKSLRDYAAATNIGASFSHAAVRKLGLSQDDDLLVSVVNALNSIGELVRKDKVVKIDVAFTVNYDNSDLTEIYRHISLLRSLNLITYGKTYVYKTNSKDLFSQQLELKSLSSGEIHIITSLLSLASVVKENSLVLIDEPELSLHPNWQIRYMNLLNKIFKKSSGCHFVIATHSHFLVSDLLPNSSAILSLIVDKRGGFNADIVPSAYGWSAESVLYNIFGVSTVRNHYFEMDLNMMLKLISEKSQDKAQISKCVNRLDRFKMPENDPLNLLLNEAKRYIESL